jgi:phospholipase/carboxylesterase
MTLVHLLREPDGAPEGALVLNHGRGTDERDLYGLLDELDPERRLLGITTGAPLTDVPPGGRHWYLVPRVGYPDPETFESSYGLLTGFLDALLEERGIGWDRTVIGGFSMGAVMSYAVALGPGRRVPAGLLAFSGFIPEVESWQPELAGREPLEILIHHGANDPVISVDFARQARALLEAGGLRPEYIETDAGHWLPEAPVARARLLVARAVAATAGTPEP